MILTSVASKAECWAAALLQMWQGVEFVGFVGALRVSAPAPLRCGAGVSHCWVAASMCSPAACRAARALRRLLGGLSRLCAARAARGHAGAPCLTWGGHLRLCGGGRHRGGFLAAAFSMDSDTLGVWLNACFSMLYVSSCLGVHVYPTGLSRHVSLRCTLFAHASAI